MKLTIDTKLKQIVIEDSVSINELNSFVVKNGYNDYTIISKVQSSWNYYPYRPAWLGDVIYCDNKPNINPVYCGVNTAQANNNILVESGNSTTTDTASFTPKGSVTFKDGLVNTTTTTYATTAAGNMSFGNFSKRDI
jgi:hypothetical protein